MKSKASLEAHLDSLLNVSLTEMGFKREQCLIFQQEMLNVRRLLRFPTRTSNGVLHFSANCAIRFEIIEQLLGNGEPLSPTLMMPLHLLSPEKRFYEWELLETDSEGLIKKVIRECKQFALPFMDRMSVLNAFKSQLLFETDYYSKVVEAEVDGKHFDLTQCDDETIKLVLSPEQRIRNLAAIYVLEGRKCEALRMIDAECDKLNVAGQLPPRIAQRLRWEQLKKQLNECILEDGSPGKEPLQLSR
jgi:hypothetical protein